MNLISKYLVAKFHSQKGRIILKDYPNKIKKEIIQEFLENNYKNILLLVDEKLEIKNSENVLSVSKAVMAQYRNKNVENDLSNIKTMVFIIDEEIDTLNDIFSINIDDLKVKFNEIIDMIDNKYLQDKKDNLKEYCKIFFKYLEVTIFDVEKFIESVVFYIEKEGYPFEEALGLSMDKLNCFKCKDCFYKFDIKNIKKIYDALSKKVGKNTISQEILELNFNNIDDCETKHKNILENFIYTSQRELLKKKIEFSQLDWFDDCVYKLFENTQKTTSKKLGKETIEFFELKDIEIKDKNLFIEFDKSAKNRELLREEVTQFYLENKILIEENTSLVKKWEKFIYPNTTNSKNFIEGILLTIQKMDIQKIDKIVVELKYKQGSAINKHYSQYAIDYFDKRFSILSKLSKNIEFKFDFIKEVENKKNNKSLSKLANTLDFLIRGYKDEQKIEEKKLQWYFDVNSILYSYVKDIDTIIENLENNKLCASLRYREKNSKGEKGVVSLLNRKSLNDRLFLKDCKDLSFILKSARELLKDEYEEFNNLIKVFMESYLQLLNSLNYKEKFEFYYVDELAQSYININQFLLKFKKDDYVKKQIIEPFFRLVSVNFNEEDFVIIPSYHPLRLVGYFVKLKKITQFLDSYLENRVHLIKEELYFSDLIQTLKHPFYPEIFIQNQELYKITEVIDDYTILESVKNLAFHQKIDPKNQTKILVQVIKNYLQLNKHKKNIKILLHYISNYEFPLRLMEELVKLNNEISFEIYLNDVDVANIRKMYRHFLFVNNKKEELLEYNEVSFLSNIRLNAISEQFNSIKNFQDKFNISFLSDFISSQSEIINTPKLLNQTIPLYEYNPILWSKRKSITPKESTIGSYLITPIQTNLSESFYNLLYLSLRMENSIPTIIVDKQKENLNDNLLAIHQKSDWVVNLDSLLDKKILEEFGANVIKYRKARYLNRNLVISSNANTLLLERNLLNKLRIYNLDINIDIKKLIKMANEISGDIVLKAIGNGSFSNELLGIVLSKKFIQNDKKQILIYIDDYKDWFLANIDSEVNLLNNNKNVLADLLIITPIFEDSEIKTIYIDIIESKFCEKLNSDKLIKKSYQQTEHSLKLFENIFKDNYDKEFWIAKISDLIVENYTGIINSLNSEEIRNQMRFNKITYQVRGISNVFIYDEENSDEIIKENLYQYIFSKDDINKILNDDFDSKLEYLLLDNIPKKVEKVVSKVKKEIKFKPMKTEIDEEVLNDVKEVVLHHSKRAKIEKYMFTPNSFRISLKAQLGWNVKDFEKMSDDFLAVKRLKLLRVEAVPGYYDLIFQRDLREKVYYKDCIFNRKLSEDFGNTKILIGKDEKDNSIVYYDLDSEDPHALIGGMTKSGKSVLLNIMIIDLITTNNLDELKLILIDPKQVEFTRYKNMPYLMENIITQKEKAIEILNNLVNEMEKRYYLFRQNEVNEIKKYNKISNSKLERIVVIFDEFADWMLDKEFKIDIEQAVQSLSGKARAAGIHLIISTQRPDNSVVVPILRANLGAKFALRVDSEKNSKIILDEEGAEKLLGNGHLLAKFASEKRYIQTAFIEDEEINTILNELNNKT